MNSFTLVDWQKALQRHGYDWPQDAPDLGEQYRPASLCYIQSADKQVLLLQRIQQPFAGRWTAPGGKIRPNETPDEAVRREVKEETGLVIAEPKLRMIVVESGPTPLLNWLLFVYLAREFTGEVQQSDEGPLRWVMSHDLDTVGMPDVDRIVSRYVLSEEPAHWAEVSLDAKGQTRRLRVIPLAAR